MSRPFESIDCAHRRPARYDERTSGPASTPRKPMRSASSLNSTNSCGLTQRVDREVPGRRAQVLGDRDDVGAGVVEVLQRLHDLFGLLAHAEDEVRLRDEPGLARQRQDAERPVVAERRPDALEDAGHRLDVVREHLGTRVEDLAQQRRIAVEVGREDLDAGVRVRRRGSAAPSRRAATRRRPAGRRARRRSRSRSAAASARRSPPRDAARPCRSRRACRCRSGRSRSGACTASRR